MADDIITAFPPYYDEVPMSRGTAGWENPPYYLTAYGLAVKHGFTGTEEEWLDSLRGDPGPEIVILGHFDTLAELEETITEPVEGDFYEVGSGSSQLVYYWCDMDDAWLPLDLHGPQGETGPAGADGAPGVDGADGASAYQQAVEAGYTGTEQEFTALLADLPGYTEQARLWAVAAGSEATAAEGYAEAAEAAAEALENLTAEDVSYSGTIGGVEVTTVKGALDVLPAGSNNTPQMDSTLGGAGVSGAWSRSDHQHPSDTSRVPIDRKINNTQLNADLALFWGSAIVLSLSWSGSGPYTQTVLVDDIPSWSGGVTAHSRIDLQPTAAQLAQLISDGVVALTVENNAGTLTAYALGATPSTAMTLACTVTEVAS